MSKTEQREPFQRPKRWTADRPFRPALSLSRAAMSERLSGADSPAPSTSDQSQTRTIHPPNPETIPKSLNPLQTKAKRLSGLGPPKKAPQAHPPKPAQKITLAFVDPKWRNTNWPQSASSCQSLERGPLSLPFKTSCDSMIQNFGVRLTSKPPAAGRCPTPARTTAAPAKLWSAPSSAAGPARTPSPDCLFRTGNLGFGPHVQSRDWWS